MGQGGGEGGRGGKDEGGRFLHASAVMLNVRETIVGLTPDIRLGRGCLGSEHRPVILTGTIASGWNTCGAFGSQ